MPDVPMVCAWCFYARSGLPAGAPCPECGCLTAEPAPLAPWLIGRRPIRLIAGVVGVLALGLPVESWRTYQERDAAAWCVGLLAAAMVCWAPTAATRRRGAVPRALALGWLASTAILVAPLALAGAAAWLASIRGLLEWLAILPWNPPGRRDTVPSALGAVLTRFMFPVFATPLVLAALLASVRAAAISARAGLRRRWALAYLAAAVGAAALLVAPWVVWIYLPPSP